MIFSFYFLIKDIKTHYYKMSILVENNEIHLIGNVEDGCIDEYVVLPFLTVFNMIEEIKPQEIRLHLSCRRVLCDIKPLIDVINSSQFPVDIYIRNSELYGGYNGIGQELTDFYTLARQVYDYREREYDPPFHLALPEIQMMREHDMYKFDTYEEEDYEGEDEVELSP
jgi:hypothetical protein